jgi:predicted ABC-class ATPase
MKFFKLFPTNKELIEALNRPSYLYCRTNEVVQLVNSNNQTNFIIRETESMPEGLEHLNDIIDFINTKHKSNISHVWISMGHDQFFDILDEMIKLEKKI